MGCSHSVHILMAINMRKIGQVLSRRWRTPPNLTAAITDHELDPEVISELPVLNVPGAATFTTESPTQFLEAARRIKAADPNVFVVLHCFSGARREGDLEEWLHVLGRRYGIKFLVASADVSQHPDWDLQSPTVVAMLNQMISDRLLDFLVGVPLATRGPGYVIEVMGHAHFAGGDGMHGGDPT